jgi:hypothetical protein
MKVMSPNHRLIVPSTYNLLQNDMLTLINAMNTSFLLVSLLWILSHQIFIFLLDVNVSNVSFVKLSFTFWLVLLISCYCTHFDKLYQMMQVKS